MYRAVLLSLTALFIAGCSWVVLDPGAEDVLVLPQARLAPDCRSLGTVKVSVANRVGALERHDEEVAADLEILARNNAFKRKGDTVVPLGPVRDGEREYGVYRCTAAGETDGNRQEESEGVEVLPYDGGRDGN